MSLMRSSLSAAAFALAMNQGSSFQAVVINQTGSSKVHGQLNTSLLRESEAVDPFQGGGIHQFQVVLPDLSGLQLLTHGFLQRSSLRHSAECQPLSGLQSSPQRGGPLAFTRRQVGIARAHCQTVRFSDNRHPDDLRAQVKVSIEGADDLKLLVILFPEDRELRTQERQQLCNHGGDTAEVTGAGRAIEPLA